MSKQIDELNQKLDQLLSRKQIFLRGIIRGVGIAIGTTIVAAVVLALLGAFLRTVDLQDAPILENIIQKPEDR